MRLPAVLATAAGLCMVSCASSPGGRAASASPPPATRSPAAASTTASVVLHAYGVDLDASAEPGSNRIQIVPDASGSLTVTLRGTDGAIRVCPVSGLGENPATSGCSTPADRTPVTISSPGVDVTRPSGKHYVDEISVSYTPRSRLVRVRAPNIIPKPGQSVCKDNGCNPVYEFTPHGTGTLTAKATWEGNATGKLLIEVGRVAERAWSARGEPYDVPVQSQRSSDEGDVRVSTTITSAEVAVVLENEGARLLRRPTLEISWP